MKAWRYGLPVVLLVSAMIVPVGLCAQEAPAAPPEPPVWIGQTVRRAVVRANGGLAQTFEAMPVDEGWLGVGISEVSAARARQAKLPRPEGVYVDSVEPDSPAAKAGVRPHDIIVEYNGDAVEGVLQFRRLVRETPPGRPASLQVWRAGHKQTLSARLTSRGGLLESRLQGLGNRLRNMRVMVMRSPLTSRPLLGIRAQDVSRQLGQYFHAPGGRGVLVVSVTSGSAAEKAGVKAGDVIDQVSGKAVHTTGELERALRENCSANGVMLGIVRKGATLQLRAPIECPQPPASTGSVTTLR